jgi:hypothetical protein
VGNKLIFFCTSFFILNLCNTMAKYLVKAREVKKQQFEEQLRKEKEEREALQEQPKPSSPQKPIPEPVPIPEEKVPDPEPMQVEKEPPPPIPKEEPPKPIHPRDLFLIPPSFSWDDLPKEKKKTNQEDMKNVRITPVPVTKPYANKSPVSKKRPRDEPSESEEDEYSSEEETPRRPSNFGATKPSLGAATLLPQPKQTGYFETIGGYARQALDMAGFDRATLGQNLLFFLGSVGLVVVRSEVQKRFAGGIPLQTIQNAPGPIGPSQPQNQPSVAPPPIPAFPTNNAMWSNYAK